MAETVIPAEAVEAAAKAGYEYQYASLEGMWEFANPRVKADFRNEFRAALEAAAPHMLADILDDAANTAETDELTTAAEVIYDLRRHAKDLRPTQ